MCHCLGNVQFSNWSSFLAIILLLKNIFVCCFVIIMIGVGSPYALFDEPTESSCCYVLSSRVYIFLIYQMLYLSSTKVLKLKWYPFLLSFLTFWIVCCFTWDKILEKYIKININRQILNNISAQKLYLIFWNTCFPVLSMYKLFLS